MLEKLTVICGGNWKKRTITQMEIERGALPLGGGGEVGVDGENALYADKRG